MAFVVQRGSDRLHPSVHHVAGRDHVRAGTRVRECGPRQQLEGRIIIYFSILEDPAVTVVCVLAQAHVGDHDQIGDLFLQRARRVLNRSLVVPGR